MEVEKQWLNLDSEEIKIKLVAVDSDKKYVLEERLLNKDNNFKTRFEKLPKYAGNKEIIYIVEEINNGKYDVSYKNNIINSKDISNDEEIKVIIRNTKLPEKTSIPVEKVWLDNNNQDNKLPESIVVRLYANGEATNQKVLLIKEVDWKATFENLDKYKDGKEIVYTVKEEGEKDGKITFGSTIYDVIYTKVENEFKIFNSYKPPLPPVPPVTPPVTPPVKSPENPETGDNFKLPVFIGAVLVAVVGLGWIAIKKRKNKDE
ncbi:Cna B-type domain-containing protein [Helcococcus bovis]|uniref:Cna B-type domain-containing protein n=1 Tax=Helcococcus bovis TaxID=3153252 RepID=UPI0038BB5B4A